MDPNACLRQFFDAENEYIHSGLDSEAAEECVEEMRECHENLCEWLQNGGFEPNWTVFDTTKEKFLNYYSE